VVALDTVRIRIVPKLAAGSLNVLKMAGYATGLAALDMIPARRQELAEGEDLLDLVGLLLAEASEQVLRQGLHADYVEDESDLPYVRGRILVKRYATQRLRQPTRIACRFDEHTTEILENRLLSAALRVALHRVHEEAVRKRIRAILPAFEEACGGEETPPPASDCGVVYNRLNAHYQGAHALARFMLHGEGIAEEGETHVESHAFLLNMDVLFERFLCRYISDVVGPRGRVAYQRGTACIIRDATTGASHSTIRPDIVLSPRHVPAMRLAIDAKYKRDIAQGDLYQGFLYAVAVSAPDHRTLLVYPTDGGEDRSQHLAIETQVGTVSAVDEAIHGRLHERPTALKVSLVAHVNHRVPPAARTDPLRA